MLTLKEYEDAALKIISNWRRKCGKLVLTDDLFGRVIRFMAKADWKYDEKKTTKTPYQYRQMFAIYAIREYIKDCSRSKYITGIDQSGSFDQRLEYNVQAGKKTQFLLENAGLSNAENAVIEECLSGKSITHAAEVLGINSKKCSRLCKSAVKKMRKISNVKRH